MEDNVVPTNLSIPNMVAKGVPLVCTWQDAPAAGRAFLTLQVEEGPQEGFYLDGRKFKALTTLCFAWAGCVVLWDSYVDLMFTRAINAVSHKHLVFELYFFRSFVCVGMFAQYGVLHFQY